MVVGLFHHTLKTVTKKPQQCYIDTSGIKKSRKGVRKNAKIIRFNCLLLNFLIKQQTITMNDAKLLYNSIGNRKFKILVWVIYDC